MTEGGGIPTNSTDRWTNDVFLNFRGTDTRAGFTRRLFDSLRERGIRTFYDDESLRRGEPISPSLLTAIEESRVGIVVFSPNYASSANCLDELVHILDHCKGYDRLVLPVFVDVDPSQVRYQTGAYREAFVKHEKRYHVEKLQRWRQALSDAANLSGWHIQLESKSEYMFIRKIIGVVSRKINRTLLHIGNHIVGLDSRREQITSLLELDSDERTIMVGIWGMEGIGKTTLARAVYQSKSGQFAGICFLEDVRRKSHEIGLVKLQETLLSELVEEKDIKFGDVSEIIPILKHRLHRKKVLLVLDDVDSMEQLESLAGGYDWFGSGSRIIITTRYPELLFMHRVNRKYEVWPLKLEEALELFCCKVFETKKLDLGYMEISKRVISYSLGYPLVLEIIGSNMFEKKEYEWHSLVDKYERIPMPKGVGEILFIPYDSLDEHVKTIFLDIACCFRGYKLDYVTDLLLNGRGFRPEYGFQVLISMSFMKIEDGLVKMHDVVQEMGREIVRRESPTEPGRRSRLWFHEDILNVLQNHGGTPSVELMKIDLPEGKQVLWDGNGFKNMENLKILEIINASFSTVPTIFPNNLRVLNWKGYFSRARANR